MDSKGDNSNDEQSNLNTNGPKSEDSSPNSDQLPKSSIHIPFCLDHCSREDGEEILLEYLKLTRQGPFAIEDEGSGSETVLPNWAGSKFNSTKSHVSGGKAHSSSHNAKRCSQGFRHHPYRSKEEEREMCFMPGQSKSPNANPGPSNSVSNVLSKPKEATSSKPGVALESKIGTTPLSNPNDDLSSKQPYTPVDNSNEVPSVPSPQGSIVNGSPEMNSEAGSSQEQDVPKKRPASPAQSPTSLESSGNKAVKRYQKTKDENNSTSLESGTSQMHSQVRVTPIPNVFPTMILRSHVKAEQTNDVQPSTSSQVGVQPSIRWQAGVQPRFSAQVGMQPSTGMQAGEVGVGERAVGAALQSGRLFARQKGGKPGKWQKKSKKPVKKLGVKKLPKRRK